MRHVASPYSDAGATAPIVQAPRLTRPASIRLVALVLVALFATSAVRISTARLSPYPSVSLEGVGELAPALNTELRWLLLSAHPSGALALTPDRQRVIPYFSNLSMLALVNRVPTVVAMYVDWYLASLNMPDRWGMYGTIYDYRVHGQDLISTRNYDSADSYAATFLTLIRRYVEATGDSEFARRRMNRIDVVAQVIISLQDKDGLVRVKPRDSTKYLMDNAEAFRGLEDWAVVLDSIGEKEAAGWYHDRAARVAAAVEYRMWDEKTGAYAWRIDRVDHASMPAWRKWYPDAVSQLYPVVNGLISPSSARARMLYEKFNRSFPYWPDVERRPGFPWGMVAWAATVMGDYGRALEFIRSSTSQFVENGGPQPWYCLESAMYIAVVDRMVALSRGGSQGERQGDGPGGGLVDEPSSGAARGGTGSPPSLSTPAAPALPSRYTRRSEAP
ncbi:MAG: hypothetical protein HPY55_10590 [Firmicutes bacterium]|nr:hypothetical protein [Bacillota bacterium]